MGRLQRRAGRRGSWEDFWTRTYSSRTLVWSAPLASGGSILTRTLSSSQSCFRCRRNLFEKENMFAYHYQK